MKCHQSWVQISQLSRAALMMLVLVLVKHNRATPQLVCREVGLD